MTEPSKKESRMEFLKSFLKCTKTISKVEQYFNVETFWANPYTRATSDLSTVDLLILVRLSIFQPIKMQNRLLCLKLHLYLYLYCIYRYLKQIVSVGEPGSGSFKREPKQDPVKEIYKNSSFEGYRAKAGKNP